MNFIVVNKHHWFSFDGEYQRLKKGYKANMLVECELSDLPFDVIRGLIRVIDRLYKTGYAREAFLSKDKGIKFMHEIGKVVNDFFNKEIVVSYNGNVFNLRMLTKIDELSHEEDSEDDVYVLDK